MDSKQRAEWQGRLDEILTGRALAGSPPHASATVILLAFILDELREIKAAQKPEPVQVIPLVKVGPIVKAEPEPLKVEAVDPEKRKPGRPRRP